MQQPIHPHQTPIWYFAFGQPPKSSLLNQYSRQHNIKYLKTLHSQELQPFINQQCIIESTIEVLLEWEPKKSNISVIFIGEQFSPEQVQVMKDYKQIARCKHYPTFHNYDAFRKSMYPNLIFFYGPNKQHRQGAAATIAFQSLYTYVQNFPQSANQIITKFKKSQNYTFSWLFTDPKQIQVLLSRFSIKIVHFHYSRSDFPNEQKYFDQEYEVMNHLQGKSYFLSLEASQAPQKLMDSIGQFLCPKLTFINSNNADQKQYALQYASDKKTELYSIFQIQSINKRKSIPLALTLQDKIRRLNEIIYNDLWKEEVVLVDFPWHANEVRVFENINRKFSHFVDLDPEREYMYSSIYTSNIYFLETQRRIHPSLQFPLKSQIQGNKRYWMVCGPQGSGKTTVSKYLSQQYGLTYIEYDTYVAGLKEKLLTPEDGEQLPLKKILKHFSDLLTKNEEEYVIDGFNGDIKSWIGEIGCPTVISLVVEENEIIKRQRKKAQSDVSAEISEDEVTKVKQLIKSHAEFTQQLTSISPETVLYNLDYNQPIILSQKLIQSIYEPRVFLIQSMPTYLYHNIAIRYNCCLINLAINNFSDIKKILARSNKRDLLIVNYQQTEEKSVSEDLYWIQKNIGTIRYLAIWAGEDKNYKEQMIHLERPVEEKKVKPVVQGEQPDEPVQQERDLEEDEIKKKKLDIYCYEWTKPICHKNLSQWYFKLKKKVQQFSLSPKQAYKSFKTKLEIINASSNTNVYEVIQPQQQ